MTSSQEVAVAEGAQFTPIIDAPANASPRIAQPEKPRLLLAILTPVNLFTGVLSCGLICLVSIWADRRWLPEALQPSHWLTALNAVSAAVFISLGLKGYWDNGERNFIFASLLGVFLLAMLLAAVIESRQMRQRADSISER